METQELRKFNERIWYLDPTVDTDRPALGYVRGDNFSIMIDAGNSAAHKSLLFRKLKENDLPLPKYCLITHWHWDHTLGIAALEIPSICSIETKKCIEDNYDNFKNLYESNPCMKAEYETADLIEVGIPEICFDKELVLDLGGVTAKMFFVGGPHSKDGTIIYVPEEKFIFAGDSSSGDLYIPGFPYDMKLLDEHEEILKGIDFEHYLHAHRPLMNRKEFFDFLDKGRKRGYYTFD